MLKRVVFVIHDGVKAPDEDEALSVVKLPCLVRGHEFPPQHIVVAAAASLPPQCLAAGALIDRALSQQLGYIFMCALLIAAQIDQGVTVAGNRFPCVLEQRLDLRHVLDDDDGADLAASHCG